MGRTVICKARKQETHLYNYLCGKWGCPCGNTLHRDKLNPISLHLYMNKTE